MGDCVLSTLPLLEKHSMFSFSIFCREEMGKKNVRKRKAQHSLQVAENACFPHNKKKATRKRFTEDRALFLLQSLDWSSSIPSGLDFPRIQSSCEVQKELD